MKEWLKLEKNTRCKDFKVLDGFCLEADSLERVKLFVSMKAKQIRRVAMMAPGLIEPETLAEYDLYGLVEVKLTFLVQGDRVLGVYREFIKDENENGY
jgi:hypothetical protein